HLLTCKVEYIFLNPAWGWRGMLRVHPRHFVFSASPFRGSLVGEIMTSARESAHAPHCLSLGAQVSEASPSAGADGRKDPSSVKLFTAFAVLAASPATVAQAQQAAEPADDLPPLVVE